MYTNLYERFTENIGKTNKAVNNNLKRVGKQKEKFSQDTIKNSY